MPRASVASNRAAEAVLPIVVDPTWGLWRLLMFWRKSAGLDFRGAEPTGWQLSSWQAGHYFTIDWTRWGLHQSNGVLPEVRAGSNSNASAKLRTYVPQDMQVTHQLWLSSSLSLWRKSTGVRERTQHQQHQGWSGMAWAYGRFVGDRIQGRESNWQVGHSLVLACDPSLSWSSFVLSFDHLLLKSTYLLMYFAGGNFSFK